MKIFLHKLTVSCMFCTMVVCFALAGCQDVVRRVDDKYRPVKEPGSVTVLADRADDLGVPIQIKNLSVDELELKVSSSDNSPVPFVPILEEGVQAGFGRITITPPSSDEPFGNFTAVIDVCSKETGEVYDSYEYTADRYPYRIYQVGNETYKFELVKMFHCDNDMTLGTGSSPALFTNDDSGEAVAKNSILTLIDSKGREGTMITFFHDGTSFVQDGYDYFEIKFRSKADVESTITLHGKSGFTYGYDSGVCSATGGGSVNTRYQDSSTDWVTLGFWNDIDSNSCLFLENWEGSVGTANQSSLSNAQNYTYMTVDTGVGQNADHATEIDYIAFFKRVEQ
ncbi:MAG: hypothetical protein IKK79_03580 [Spirochaetaceae bacterium]|nr:hypothetical protein [Spirochaetaceae bacterium]